MGSTALGRLGGSGGGSKITITQPGHDFVPGNVVRYDGGVGPSGDQYVKAIAKDFNGVSADVNAEVIGVVESVTVDTFTMVMNGKIETSTITNVTNFNQPNQAPIQGEFYFLSDVTPGVMTNVPPQDASSIRKTISIQTTSGGIGFVQNYLGIRNREIFEDLVNISSIQPVGMIAPFGGTAEAIPTGWLVCDGSLYDPFQYPELSTVIGRNYGSGTEFRLPDLRGRFALGSNPTVGGNSSYMVRGIGDSGGEEMHALQISELPAHDHPGSGYEAYIDDLVLNENNYETYGAVYGIFVPPTPTVNVGPGGASVPVSPVNANGPLLANDWSAYLFPNIGDDYDFAFATQDIYIAPQGNDVAHNNMPPFQVVNWIIRASANADAAIITVNLRNLRDVDTTRGFPTNNNQKNGDLVSWNSTEQKFVMRPDTASVNYCQNGAFDKWTNGITFNDAAFTAAYTANNWYYERSGTVGGTDRLFQVERGGAVPGHNAANSFQGLTEPIAGHDFVPSAFANFGITGDSLLIRKIQPLTESQLGLNQFHSISFFVDGRDYAQLLQAEWFTLSFWSWTPQDYFTVNPTHTIGVSFRNQASNGREGRRFVDQFRPVQNQWTKHEIKVPVDAIQQWNFNDTSETDNYGLKITFALSVGTNRRTAFPRAWLSGANIIATVDQASPLNNVTNGNVNVGSYWLGLAQVQLEAGAYSSNFKLPEAKEKIWKPQSGVGIGQIRTSVSGNVAQSIPNITLTSGKWVCTTMTMTSGNDREKFVASGVTEHIVTSSTEVRPLGSNTTYATWFIIAQRVE